MGTGKQMLTAMFENMESMGIDEIHTGPYHQLFHPEHLIKGREDASSNYVTVPRH